VKQFENDRLPKDDWHREKQVRGAALVMERARQLNPNYRFLVQLGVHTTAANKAGYH